MTRMGVWMRQSASQSVRSVSWARVTGAVRGIRCATAFGALPRENRLRRARLGLGRRGLGFHRLVRRLASAVHPVAQLLARPEEDPALRLDRNHLSGLRVAPVVALVVLDVEGAEAADFDVVSPAQRLLHRVENRLDRELGLLLCEL